MVVNRFVSNFGCVVSFFVGSREIANCIILDLEQKHIINLYYFVLFLSKWNLLVWGCMVYFDYEKSFSCAIPLETLFSLPKGD